MTTTESRLDSKIVLMMGISLDGFVAVPSGNGLTPLIEGLGGLPPEDPELKKAKLAWIWEAGAHLMGRITSDEMATFWPTSTADYAAPMNEIPKVVFSKGLERADWPESRVARGDLADEIAKLKGESDKDLIAWGGASFAQSLARRGIVDEYRLTTHPVAVGDGEPLFKDIPAPVRLKLVDTKIFNSAAVHVFQPA
jgi:dihydrofolate reductase